MENAIAERANGILKTEWLYRSSTVLQLDANLVKGLCLRDGSEQAHGAIIARAAGIVWLCQQGEALNDIQPGEAIALDMRNQRLIRD